MNSTQEESLISYQVANDQQQNMCSFAKLARPYLLGFFSIRQQLKLFPNLLDVEWFVNGLSLDDKNLADFSILYSDIRCLMDLECKLGLFVRIVMIMVSQMTSKWNLGPEASFSFASVVAAYVNLHFLESNAISLDSQEIVQPDLAVRWLGSATPLRQQHCCVWSLCFMNLASC